jgi:hypothetical protein
LRLQSSHSIVIVPLLTLPSCALPRSTTEVASYREQLAIAFSSYLNNWASLADGSAVDAFLGAARMLPAYCFPVLLLRALQQSTTVDGSLVLAELISHAFKPSPLAEVFRTLKTVTHSSRASCEELFRLVSNAPSFAAAVLKQQTPAWFDASIFVPAFIAAILINSAADDAVLLELVLSLSCVQGYTRHTLAVLEAMLEAGSNIALNIKLAVAEMKLPVLLRIIDHAVSLHQLRRAHRAVLGAVLSLQPSHAAITYISTELWHQRSLTHAAACALVDLLLSTGTDFSTEPLHTVLHCLSDVFSRESFASSAHESHHFAVCAALRRMLIVPNSATIASGIMPLLFNGISNHLKCLVDTTRKHGMWVAEAVAPLLSAQSSEPLLLLQADEREHLQKLLDTEDAHDVTAVLYHMVNDDAVAAKPSSSCGAKTRHSPQCKDSSGSSCHAAGGVAIGVTIADDGWGSDGDGSGFAAAGPSESDEDDVVSYDLPTEVRDKMWSSLEAGLELLLHEDANKVEQAIRVAAQSIRCSRQIISEFSHRLWKALQHARAKFDDDQISVHALSAMSQVCSAVSRCCASLCAAAGCRLVHHRSQDCRLAAFVVNTVLQIIERDPVGGGALVAKDFWSSQRSIR